MSYSMVDWGMDALFLWLVCGVGVRGCYECCSPCGSRDRGDWAVIPGVRFYGALCVVVISDAVGVAVVSTNQRA